MMTIEMPSVAPRTAHIAFLCYYILASTMGVGAPAQHLEAEAVRIPAPVQKSSSLAAPET
jgi:hypothetical protein